MSWFDGMGEDEVVTTAMLLGCRFMTEAERAVPGYGPHYHRYMDPEHFAGWSIGYMSRTECARAYLFSRREPGGSWT